jgi:hypothetical protein
MQFNIKIDQALAVLEKNLQEHIVELAEANQVWTAQTVRALEELRDATKRDGLKASYEKVQQLFYKKPQDNRAMYSKFIGALKQAQVAGELNIQMDEDDYDRTFNDNWDWRIQSKTANSSYKN